jgi:hypothetical protein
MIVFEKFWAKNLTNSTNVPKIAFENRHSRCKRLSCSPIKNVSSLFYTFFLLEVHPFFLVHYKQIFQLHEIQYVSNGR